MDAAAAPRVEVPAYTLELMAALGPQTGSIECVGFDPGQGAWWVGFENRSAVLLEWFGEQESFLLQASLGEAPPHARLAAYQAVLVYNALWRENGGARVAMVKASGELALMLQLPARALTLDELQRVVLGLCAQAAEWRRWVAHADDPDDPDAGGPQGFPSPSHRV